MEFNKRLFFSLIALSIIIRVAFFLISQPISFGMDSDLYRNLANQIAKMDWHNLTGEKPPLYPSLLLLCGLNNYAVWVVQSILGILISVMLYLITFQQSKSNLLSFIVGLLHSVNIDQLYFESAIMTETLATFFTLLSLFLLIHLLKRSTLKFYEVLVLGITVAAAGLIRSNLLFLVVLFFLILSVHLVKLRFSLLLGMKYLTFYLLPFLVMVGGWGSLMKLSSGHFTTTTMMGYNLCNSIGDIIEYASDDYQPLKDIYLKYRDQQKEAAREPIIFAVLPAMQQATGLSYSDLSNRLVGLFLDVVSRHPLLYLKTVAASWIKFWNIPRYDIKISGFKSIFAIVYSLEIFLLVISNYLFFILIGYYCLQMFTRNPLWSFYDGLFALVVLGASITSALFEYGNCRYSIPFVPLIIYFVCINLHHVIRVKYSKNFQTAFNPA